MSVRHRTEARFIAGEFGAAAYVMTWGRSLMQAETQPHNLDRAFQPHITRFHSVFHARREHTRSGLRIGQGHPHRHQCTGTVRVKPRFQPFPAKFGHMRAYFDRLTDRHSFQRVIEEAKPYFSLFPFADDIPQRFRESS
jgi:hypothetical protein